MVGRDRRARRKGNFPKQFATGPGSERRRQVRDGEDAMAGAPGGRALPLSLTTTVAVADSGAPLV
jgi:hypothetical protein